MNVGNRTARPAAATAFVNTAAGNRPIGGARRTIVGAAALGAALLAAWACLGLPVVVGLGAMAPGGLQAGESPAASAAEKATPPAPAAIRASAESMADDAADWLWVYFGTYTRGESKGIYRAKLDRSTGALTDLQLAAELVNPSFLALHPKLPRLYACGEVGEFAGGKGGAVSALAIDEATGGLTLLNQQTSGGVGPCHLSVDPAGRNVLVANYGGGSVAALPLDDEGRLKAPSSVVQHSGFSGVHPTRQKGPHAHSVNLSPDGRFAFVADLGQDKLMVYRFDSAAGLLAANDPPSVALAPGAGPRHFAMHPSGRFGFVINELNATITSLAYDASSGVFRVIDSASTLPPEFDGRNTSAEVVVHPSGRFVYGSNRGHDSIAVFALDESTGRLTARGQTPCGGRTPRNFAIEPSGRFLLAANQDSGNVVVFRIDPNSGDLKPAGVELKVPVPVCVRFRAPAKAR